MGTHVVTMIRSAMEAFRTRDLELCLKLPKMDDPVDRLNRATHLEALKLADDPRALDWGLHMNLAARALERVGDNAVDIGEQVGFLITGEFREFTDASHDVPELGRRHVSAERTPDAGSCVVEDEESLADTVRYNLEREGYAVAVAADGRRALERFREDDPVARDPRPDAARDLRARRLPADPADLERADHHGDRQGLGGRQGLRARARRRRLRDEAVLGPRARLSGARAPAPGRHACAEASPRTS